MVSSNMIGQSLLLWELNGNSSVTFLSTIWLYVDTYIDDDVNL